MSSCAPIHSVKRTTVSTSTDCPIDQARSAELLGEARRHGVGRGGAVRRGWLSILSVCAVLLSVSTARAQLIKHFDRTFGGSGDDCSSGDGVVLVVTADGGALIGTTSPSGAEGDKSEPSKGALDYWIVKTDASGNKQWDRTFGGSAGDSLGDALQTPDGGYLLVGSSSSDIGGDKSEVGRGGGDYWVIRLDPLGNKLWDKTLGGPGSDVANDVLATSDGGYLVVGFGGTGVGWEKSLPSYGGYGGWDYWVVKIGANGNKLWDQVFGGSGADVSFDAIQLSNGTFVIGGHSASDASGNKTTSLRGGWDYWVVAIDADGNKLWEQAYGSDGSDLSHSMVATSDGGFAIAGASASDVSGEKSEPSRGGYDLWLVKADAAGNKQWDRTVGSAVNEDWYREGVVQTDDGGFLMGIDSLGGISGDRTERSRGNRDYWLVRLDASGKKLWDKAIGGSKGEWLTHIGRSLDGGYFLAGLSNSDVSFEKSEPCRGNRDLWLVKTFELSTLVPSVSGMTYVDLDNDCSYDPMVDSPLANRLIEATPGPYFAQSDAEGQFALRLPGGDYTVEQAGLAYSPFAQTCPGAPGSFPVSAVSGSLTPAGAFGNAGPANGSVEITTAGTYPPPLTTPCWGQHHQECVTFTNAQPALHNPHYEISIDGGLSQGVVTGATADFFCHCVPTWVGNTISCISNLPLPANGACTICVTVDVPPWPQPSLPNDSITVESSVSGYFGNNEVYSTASEFVDPILCSYDPNDRTLLHPGACGEAGLIPSGQPLTYRTRFQNLGNAPAHNVVVDETLDDALDPATFKLLGSNYNVTRAEIFPGNRLILSFIGIELPPEQSDPLGSVGTVLYSIRPKANMPTPWPIQSRAAIFFDLNEPVITNETLHTLVDTLPPVSFTAPPAMCITDPPVALSGGLPAGGTYAGYGVTGDIFDPAVAGVGAHSIQYAYTASVADTSYALNQVGTFAPLPGSGAALSLGDDQISAALPIGFTFNFYGNDYSELYVSSNGFITFSAGSNLGCCAGGILPGKQTNPSNLIAFAWDDLYPPGSGSFDVFTTGDAPNRVFVLNVTNVAVCCNSTPKITAQVLLYEGTNIIEIHTANAASFNGMTMGIEDDGGLFATVVPGRNSAIYSIANDFVQFIPPASTTFCSDVEAQTILVNPQPIASIMASGPTTLCSGDSVTLTASGGTSYAWSTGASDAALVVASPGTYSVLVTDANGCAATAEIVVNGVNPDDLDLPCATGAPGVCADGKTSCVDGAVVCSQNGQPSAELCDGLDNNCDGQIDEFVGCQMGNGGGGSGTGGGGGAGGGSSGTGGGGGGGAGGAGGGDSGSGGVRKPGEESGCNCRAAGTASEEPRYAALPLFGIALLGIRSRRRARRDRQA